MFFKPIRYAESGKPVEPMQDKSALGRTKAFVSDPLKMLRGIAQAGDGIVEAPMYVAGNPAYITDADLAHAILVKEYKTFIKAPRSIGILKRVLGMGLVTNNDIEFHKKQRKLAQPGFHFRRIQGFAETMVDYTDKVTSEWRDGEERDISDDMYKLTMYIVLKTLFDTDFEDVKEGADEIAHAIDIAQAVTIKRVRSLVQIPEWMPTKTNRMGQEATQTITRVIDGLIEQRRLPDGSYEDKGDLLSMLLLATYEDGSSMDRQQLRDELVTLFVAGHETTSNAMTWCFYLVATHPDIQERLYQEVSGALGDRLPTLEDLEQLPLTEMVIKETLRMYPPAWALNLRSATETTELGDYVIPAGRPLILSPYLFHYKPKYFPDPMTFDPDRFSPEREQSIHKHAYLPFGSGPRVCIGNSFAMMEARLILAIVVSRFHLELSPDQIVDTHAQITLSAKHGMRLKLSARRGEGAASQGTAAA